LEDVEILSEDIPGWQVANQGRLTVALDITITDDLKDKGLSPGTGQQNSEHTERQGFRDYRPISVRIKGPESIHRSVKNNFDYIRTEILATELELVDHLEGSDVQPLEVDEELQVLTSVNKY
jgi:isoleucyl-tRNA synthetase